MRFRRSKGQPGLALCEQLGRSNELLPVLRGLWNYHQGRGELQQVYDLAERLVMLPDEQEAPLRVPWRGVLAARRFSCSAGLPMRRQRWTRASRSMMRSRPGKISLTDRGVAACKRVQSGAVDLQPTIDVRS
jgi:hypothetical protein